MPEGRYVSLAVHYEEGTWWCDSSEIPGFTAAADTRNELIRRSHDAVVEILAAQGEQLGTFVWCHFHQPEQSDGSDG
jgi:predicted RNase H-like HicB family nuclease